MRPDPSTYNPAPEYVRALIEATGLSQRAAAKLLNVSDRAVRFWVAGEKPIPYTAQFALECLAMNPPLRGPLAVAPMTGGEDVEHQ